MVILLRGDLSNVGRQFNRPNVLFEALSSHFQCSNFIVPAFQGNNLIFLSAFKKFRKKVKPGGLATRFKHLRSSFLSNHHSHSFVGIGAEAVALLRRHDSTKECFWPARMLIRNNSLTMVNINLPDDKNGFSTVHVAQYLLGLSRFHLSRFFYSSTSCYKVPIESPGCSRAFHKMLIDYDKAEILKTGKFKSLKYCRIDDSKKALQLDIEMLRKKPKFFHCKRVNCISCSLKYYK